MRWNIEEASYRYGTANGLQIILEHKAKVLVKQGTSDRTKEESIPGFWAGLAYVLTLGSYNATRTVEIKGEPAEYGMGWTPIHSGSTVEYTRTEPEDLTGWLESYNGAWYKPGEVSSENITKIAEEVWNFYINKCHRTALEMDKAEHARKFVGIYPPKNLAEVTA
jgi:hypothetical protein